jgi:cytochrome b561
MRSLRYAPVAIGLHWLIALAILFQISLGWRMDDHAHGAQTYLVFQLHKSVGITILLLSLIRLGWRLSHPPPPLPANLTTWERRLAALTHIGFYVIMIGLPLTGWLIVSASKTQIPTLLYGTVPWPHLPGLAHAPAETKAAWHFVGEAGHGVLAKLTYLLFALHVAGALKHHLFDRDDTLAAGSQSARPRRSGDRRGPERSADLHGRDQSTARSGVGAQTRAFARSRRARD